MGRSFEAAELREQYDRALAEYRFQVELNWKRTQYFFALTTAVTAAGVGLLSSAAEVDRPFLGALFLVGMALAGLAHVVNQTQHDYYRSARDLAKSIEAELALGPYGLRTTPGMGSGRRRRLRVGSLQKWMLALIGAVNLAGLIVTLT